MRSPGALPETITVASLELPPGVQAASAAGALDAYHVTVPEPAADAAAAAALALLATRRARR